MLSNIPYPGSKGPYEPSIEDKPSLPYLEDLKRVFYKIMRLCDYKKEPGAYEGGYYEVKRQVGDLLRAYPYLFGLSGCIENRKDKAYSEEKAIRINCDWADLD